MTDASSNMPPAALPGNVRKWSPCRRPCSFDENCCRNVGMEQMEIAGPAGDDAAPFTIKVMVPRGSDLARSLKDAADHGTQVAQQILDAAPVKKAEDKKAADVLIASSSRGTSYIALCETRQRLFQKWKESLSKGSETEQRHLWLAQSKVGAAINKRTAGNLRELRALAETLVVVTDGSIDLDPNGPDEVGRMVGEMLRAVRRMESSRRKENSARV